jgi:hypothetical protein
VRTFTQERPFTLRVYNRPMEMFPSESFRYPLKATSDRRDISSKTTNLTRAEKKMEVFGDFGDFRAAEQKIHR